MLLSLILCLASQDVDALDPDVARVPVVTDLAPRDTRVITGEELLARGYRTLGEALAYEVGFVHHRTSRGPQTALRGMPAGIALVVDGVPEARDGARDRLDVEDSLDLRDVDRVEIVRGPVTALSGVGALVGVVRVTTKRPGLTGAGARLAASSLAASDGRIGPGFEPGPVEGERELGGEASARSGDLALRVSGRVRAGPSMLWRLESAPVRFEQIGLTRLAVTKENSGAAVDDGAMNARATLAAGDAVLDASVISTEERAPVSSFSHGIIDEPQLRARQVLRARALYGSWFGPAHVDAAVQVTRADERESIPLYPTRGIFPAGGELVVETGALLAATAIRMDAPSFFEGHRVALSLFSDLTALDAKSRSTDPRSGVDTDSSIEFHDVTGTISGAAEYQADLGFGLHATGGVVVEARTAFPLALAPRVAVAWDALDALTLRLSYAEGTRAPDRFDMIALAQAVVDERVIGAEDNPTLRPEHIRSGELALSYSPSAAFLVDARAFLLRHEDAVENVIDRLLLVPTNLEPRVVAGAEATSVIQLGRLHLRGGAGLARTLDGPDLGVDAISTLLDASYVPLDPLTVGGRARALIRDETSASAVVDAYATITAIQNVSLTLTIKNLTDAIERSPDLDAQPLAEPLLYPAPGRTLVIAVEGRM